jgi:hypothetical protein
LYVLTGSTSRASKTFQPKRCGLISIESANCLPNAEEVTLAVPEPRRFLPFATLGGVVPLDFSDAADRLEARQVILFEHHAAAAQLGDRRVQVLDLPSHLRVRA